MADEYIPGSTELFNVTQSVQNLLPGQLGTTLASLLVMPIGLSAVIGYDLSLGR